MPTPDFQPLGGDPTTQQIQDYIIKLIRDLNFLLSNLDTLNVNRLDAKVVIANTITADKMNVQQLSAIAADLGTITAGIIFGAYIATSNGTFPRIEFSSVDKLLKAYLDATHYIFISPNTTGAPTLEFKNPGGSADLFMAPDDSGNFTVNGSVDTNIFAGGNVKILCGTGKQISVNSWNEVWNRLNGISLQSALNAKANAFSGVSGTVYVSTTSGGAATTPITFSNGIRTS